MESIDVKELKNWKENGRDYELIDVREVYEHELSNLGGRLLPMSELQNRIEEIPRTGDVILYCRSGQRSAGIIRFLKENHGYSNLINLDGGILAWRNQIEPDMEV